MRRSFTAAIVVAAIAAVIAPMPGQAQSDYPNRVVKIVVPYAAGSVPDILVRALTPGLSGRLGQQFIVENRAGGSGALGTASVARAEADGYTVLFAPAVVLSVLPQARNDTGYKPDSLVPVCQTFVNTMGLAVRPEFADQDHRRLGRCGKAEARRAELRPSRRHDHSASRGRGIPAGRRRSTSRTSRSAADRRPLTELLAGRIDVRVDRHGTEVGQNIRVIGVFGEKRLAYLPDVPTVKEQGYDVSPGELRRLAGAACNASADLVQALLGLCRSGKERSVCDDRQERRPARRLFRRRGGVPAASRARHREQGARALASQDAIKRTPARGRGSQLTHARGSLLRRSRQRVHLRQRVRRCRLVLDRIGRLLHRSIDRAALLRSDNRRVDRRFVGAEILEQHRPSWVYSLLKQVHGPATRIARAP